jgi:hypothetical protein
MRPFGRERIERRTAGRHTGGPHVLLKPADHLEPVVRLSRARLLDARRNPSLHLLYGQRHIVEIAFQQRPAGFDGMHVPIDEAGHHKAPLEIYFDGRWTDIARKRRVAADVENSSVANRQRARG